MTVDDWLKVAAVLGFPSAVTGYLLWRLDQDLRSFTDALHKLRETLTVVFFIAENPNRDHKFWSRLKPEEEKDNG